MPAYHVHAWQVRREWKNADGRLLRHRTCEGCTLEQQVRVVFSDLIWAPFCQWDQQFAGDNCATLKPISGRPTWTKLRMIEKSKLPRIRLHDLRHIFATIGLSKNIHPKVMSEMLGHSKIALTLDVYSHALPSLQADAADKIAEALTGR
jgi:hypothetical protein